MHRRERVLSACKRNRIPLRHTHRMYYDTIQARAQLEAVKGRERVG